MHRFLLEPKVENTSTQFHLATLEILNLFFMHVMYLDLIQKGGSAPMSSLSVFHFPPLSNSDTSAARTTIHAWDTLLEGSSVSSMCDTAELFLTTAPSPP